MGFHLPFSYRVILLLGLMLVVASVDFYRHGAQAAKFREYGFVSVAGAIGGAVGFLNDSITSSISPDYFILGKGLDDGPNLRMQAALYGMQAGFSAGIIAGAVCLFVVQKKSPRRLIKYSRSLLMLWMPVAGAVLGGALVPLAFSRFDPAHFAAQLDGLLDAGRLVRFRQVWWVHIGLYFGMMAGLAVMIFHLLTHEKKSDGAGGRI